MEKKDLFFLAIPEENGEKREGGKILEEDYEEQKTILPMRNLGLDNLSNTPQTFQLRMFFPLLSKDPTDHYKEANIFYHCCQKTKPTITKKEKNFIGG